MNAARRVVDEVPRYKREYTFGNVLQVVALVVTIVGSISVAMWSASGWQATTDVKVLELAKAIDHVGQLVAANTAALQTLVSSQNVQDERIAQLGAQSLQARQSNENIMAQLSAIREDLASIKEQIKTKVR